MLVGKANTLENLIIRVGVIPKRIGAPLARGTTDIDFPAEAPAEKQTPNRPWRPRAPWNDDTLVDRSSWSDLTGAFSYKAVNQSLQQTAPELAAIF